MSKSIEEQIKEKVAILRENAKLYETGKAKITDLEWDTLYNDLKELDPNNSFFDEAGGTLDEQHLYGKKIAHKVIMGSLNKCADIDSFSKWIGSTYPDTNILEFVLQYKIDGLSLGCVYKSGKLQYVATRGNSTEGVDVTNNARFISGIPETIKCKEDVEIRGECFKDRADFYKNWVGEYENPRNFCSGSVNQLNPETTRDRKLSFVSYEAVRKEFKKEVDKIKFLSDNGFETLEKSTEVISGIHEKIVEKVKKYMDAIKRDELPFSIDGIVVKINDLSIKNELGYVSDGRRPRSNVAVKFPCEQVSAEIKDIEWSVGKTGKIVPVAILSPVRLNETTVKRVTLHNIKFIKEMELKIGSNILIQKSGEIIPYCLRKISDKNNSTTIPLPTHCPNCKTELIWDDTETSKICTNINCPAQLSGKLDYYCKTIGIKGIGSGIIDTLIEKKYVTCISDLYNLENHTKELSDVFGNKAFANILEAIDEIKEVPLSTLITSLSIANIGRMSKEITRIAPTVDEIDNLKEDDISSIGGFGPVKSKNFIMGWKLLRSEISKILRHIKIEEIKTSGSKLSGKSFCVTGTLSRLRNDVHLIIEDNGGTVLSSVSSKLNYLICGEDSGSKRDKAEKLGIKIISEDEFNRMLK